MAFVVSAGRRHSERLALLGVIAASSLGPMNDELPQVEVVSVGGTADEQLQGSVSRFNVHAWLRTTAAIVGALALLWIAVSFAGTRQAEERHVCFDEIQMAAFGFGAGPNQSQDLDRDEFIAEISRRADACGLPLLGEAIRQRYASE